MYLKSLRVQGFKTFARRIDLPFGRGITAIVGPNGSGKSNLVDAIRWALGERNARGLRGNRMEDVIYAGGPGKSAVGMAEVSLTIDNAEQRINVEFSEIEVARRLFRSGESEYLINGTRARLKDIDALLASTGLRQDGYAVVAQNDIDYVIQAAPALRRELIEEAAGVRRLRDQRQEALNRLNDAERDMRRARDLLDELNPRAEELRSQAVAAEEYQRVAAQLKVLQGSLARDTWRKAMVQLRKAQTREQMARNKREAATAALADFEPVYERHRTELASAREARWNHQQALADLRLRLADAEHQVRIAEQRRESARQALDAAREETTRLQASERAGGQVVEELERAVQEAVAELEESKRLAAGAAADESAGREARAGLEADRETCDRRLQEIHRARLTVQAELRQLEGRCQFLREQRDAAQAELTAWSERNSQLLEELDRQRAMLESAERQLGESRSAVAGLDARLSDAAGAVSEAERIVESAGTEAQVKDAEYAALSLLRERAQPRSPLSEKTDIGLERLLHAVTVPVEFQPAVEAVLADWLLGWVAADMDSADRAISLLSGDGTSERETILFNPPAGAADPVPAGVESLKDRVKAPAAIQPLIDRLLAQVAVAENLAAARRLLNANPDLRVVTRSGELVTSFAYRGGRPPHAPLQAEAQFREVESARERTQKSLRIARASLQSATAAQAGLLAERAAAQVHLDAARAEHARVNALASAGAVAGDRERALGQDLAGKVARLVALLLDAERLEAGAEERQERSGAEEDRARQELAAIDQRLGEHDGLRAGHQQRRQEAELRTALCAQRHEDLIRQLDRARQVWRSHGDDLAQRQAAAQALATQPSVIETERLAWVSSAGELTVQLAGLEAEALPDGDALRTLEEQLQQDEQRNVVLKVAFAQSDDAVGSASEEIALAKAEVERCAEALREDGQALHDPESMEEVDWQKTEREVSRLQRRLDGMGAVNLLAPEEFGQLQARCESLATQLTDLEAAAAQLTELRQRLEEEIDSRFRTVFQSVAVNFQEFFVELFEGGRATLRLDTQHDGNPLDDGVEILAQTPGKRLQPLTLLSGGERALTALAFLFALQAVNPSPFHVLDEVDAALDDANVVRFNRVLRRLANDHQFLIVTHNHSTMAQAEVLYGVTLAEHGISRIVSVRLEGEASRMPRIATSRTA